MLRRRCGSSLSLPLSRSLVSLLSSAPNAAACRLNFFSAGTERQPFFLSSSSSSSSSSSLLTFLLLYSLLYSLFFFSRKKNFQKEKFLLLLANFHSIFHMQSQSINSGNLLFSSYFLLTVVVGEQKKKILLHGNFGVKFQKRCTRSDK